MKCEVLQSMCGRVSHNVGDIIDVPDDGVQGMIDAGIVKKATPENASKKTKASRTATKPESEAR